jgi:hypothetical protein
MDTGDVKLHPHEVVVTHCNKEDVTISAKLERIARIVSLVAIPIVIAMSGKIIDDTLASREIKQKYVELAVSILKADQETKDDSLRKWAVELLDDSSPIKFNSKLVEQLKQGTIPLPSKNDSRPVGNAFNFENTSGLGAARRIKIQAYDDQTIKIVRYGLGAIMSIQRLHLNDISTIKLAILFEIKRRFSLITMTDGKSVWILQINRGKPKILAKLGYLDTGDNIGVEDIEINEKKAQLLVRRSNGTSVVHELSDIIGFDLSGMPKV